MKVKIKTKKAKRVVLGVGHPWFSKRTGIHNYDAVSIFTENMSGTCVPLKLGTLGGYNKIRLVAEVIE